MTFGKDDFVLFKASRGMALEQMAEGLLGKDARRASPDSEDDEDGTLGDGAKDGAAKDGAAKGGSARDSAAGQRVS